MHTDVSVWILRDGAFSYQSIWPSHSDSMEPEQWLLGGKSCLFFLPRQLSRTWWCHPFLSFKYKLTYPPCVVITYHQGARGLRDTVCLGDWQAQLLGGQIALVGLCGALGRRESKTFLFLQIGFVSGAFPSPQGYRPGVRPRRLQTWGTLDLEVFSKSRMTPG